MMSIVNLLLCGFYLIQEYKRKAAVTPEYYIWWLLTVCPLRRLYEYNYRGADCVTTCSSFAERN